MDTTLTKIVLIQQTFRRFRSEKGMVALFDKVYPNGVDAAHDAWAEGHKEKEGVLPLLQMLSRLCCRKIELRMAEIVADSVLSVAVPNINLLNAHEFCPNVFVDAFFISSSFFADHQRHTKTFGAPSKKEEDLKEAALALAASPIDRFHMLTPYQREKLVVGGKRLVMCYNDVLKEVFRSLLYDGVRIIELTVETALKYEIALASFHDMHREHHTHPRCYNTVQSGLNINEMRRHPQRKRNKKNATEYEETTSLQSAIDVTLGEIASTLQRTLKRTRVIEAAKTTISVSRKHELVRVIALQEEQISRLVQHISKKIKEMVYILGVEPLPWRLLDHLRHVLVMALSTGSSELKTRHAAFGVVKTVVLYGRSHNNDAFKDAGAFIYAAAIRADPNATAEAIQKVAHVPFTSPNLVLPNIKKDEMTVDAWRVLLTSFQQGNTGAAAYLIADVISVSLNYEIIIFYYCYQISCVLFLLQQLKLSLFRL
jgi:hypothetical protein